MSENPLDRGEEPPGPTALNIVLVCPFPISFPFLLVTLILGRWLLVHVDVHDLVTREIAQDDAPRDLGHAHELVGASYEQGDAVAVKGVQFGPEFQHRIDGLVVGLGGWRVRHVLVVAERDDVDGLVWRTDPEGRHGWWWGHAIRYDLRRQGRRSEGRRGPNVIGLR